MTARCARLGPLALLIALCAALFAQPASATEAVGVWTTGRFDNYKDLYFEESRWCLLRFNADGTASVRVEQRAWNKPGKVNKWTHNFTLFLDGKQVGRIVHDPSERWTDGNYHTATCDFTVPKGKHHLTTTNEQINDDVVVNADWDFWISVPFDINASSGTGGTIDPNGNSKADPGSTKVYKITADKGYRVKDVIVDGKSQGAKDTYTFTGIDRDHTISATFQKTWDVTFRDHDGTELKRQTVDDGGKATAPDPPKRDGYEFTGWDKDFSKVTTDLTVTAVYKPIITVRVPTLVACTVLPTGEVLEPTGYKIDNLSKVPIKATSITASNQSPHTTVHIDGKAGEVWSTSGVNRGFSIAREASIPLSWRVDDLDGERNAALLDAALVRNAKVVDVAFTFEAE